MAGRVPDVPTPIKNEPARNEYKAGVYDIVNFYQNI
jgi:hypothetical protein